ncbi:hypothetical protein HETIRDRAFT_306695 [Heterobasidion irregulare TC 32-1]|uniref:Uncharacterized protein n=1 Tax=Heterobasidion irregulare (strain TC 32-1) TaxID=747525 RepID=W4KPW3_HETIT|nr:uncharacterized protein HETIRDRAFT_306695 [Heterobasidion irregulare TC 32-1]ETW87832.1 hypothetical protein HETIRDRAFT_306695 [Heterobasidion irregulare TC 32-1]
MFCYPLFFSGTPPLSIHFVNHRPCRVVNPAAALELRRSNAQTQANVIFLIPAPPRRRCSENSIRKWTISFGDLSHELTECGYEARIVHHLLPPGFT